MEEQVAAVAWIAKLLAQNDVVVIVCCMAPFREQRLAMRHKSFESGISFYEVWVDGIAVTPELERKFSYEYPDPPDSRVVVKDSTGWDLHAHRVIFELDL